MKVIFVTGDDYAALEFEQSHEGQEVSNFIETYFDEGETSIEYTFLTDNQVERTVEIELLQFASVSLDFVKFVRNQVQDYDQSKHENFYCEGQII